MNVGLFVNRNKINALLRSTHCWLALWQFYPKKQQKQRTTDTKKHISVCVRVQNNVTVSLPTSLQTSMVPKTICRPSKKLSPMMMTVVPPVVQPSLGHMAFIQGVAVEKITRNVYTPQNTMC